MQTTQLPEVGYTIQQLGSGTCVDDDGKPEDDRLKGSEISSSVQIDRTDQAPSVQIEVPVWTRPAKMFMLSISLFVFSTVALLAYLIQIQRIGLTDLNYAWFSQHDVWIIYVLQGQTVMAEFILLLIAYHAVATKNMISIMATLGFNVILVISGLLEVVGRHDSFTFMEKSLSLNLNLEASRKVTSTVTLILWIIPAVDLAFHIGCDWAAWLLYKELGWIAYKRVSADLRIRTRYKHVLILRSLQLLQAIMAAHLIYYILTIHHLTSARGHLWLYGRPAYPYWIDLTPRSPAIYLYIVPSAIAMVSSMLCVTFGTAREHRWALGLALLGQCLMLSLLPIAFFKTRVTPQSYTGSKETTSLLANSWKAYFQLSLFILFSLASIVWTFVVSRGFHQGLKDILDKKIHTHEKVNLSAEV